jgi:two-component system sensor histidine kinase KdpD
VAAIELERLTRLFDEILDMARIDAGTCSRSGRGRRRRRSSRRRSPRRAALAGRDVRIDARDDVAVEIDPRLAVVRPRAPSRECAQYAPDGPIAVRGWTDPEGLRLDVRDEGPGLQAQEIERLFEPFYRGELLRHRVPGTGMGLAITRGLVAADRGRVWAENVSPRGACFSIAVPARTRPLDQGAE